MLTLAVIFSSFWLGVIKLKQTTMAAMSGLFTLNSICPFKSHIPSPSSSIQLGFLHLHSHGSSVNRNPTFAVVLKNNKFQRWRKIVRSVAEETLIPEETDQPVAAPVSPSDALTMFFQAEGTMNETAIPIVTNALEQTEGIANLKVQVIEGIASVELTKETTVQATGVASNLIEIIQGSGFKLQTLNLSFEDEENIN